MQYAITATDVRDLAGNQIEPRRATPPLLIDPRRAEFRGIAPARAENGDADGDTLPDNVEELGWTVTVKRENGNTFSYAVTSDPDDPDSDGDLPTDDVEQALGTDRRRRDTDGDGLSDNDEFNVVYSDTNVVDWAPDPCVDCGWLRDPGGAQRTDTSFTVDAALASKNVSWSVADLPAPRIKIDGVPVARLGRPRRPGRGGRGTRGVLAAVSRSMAYGTTP